MTGRIWTSLLLLVAVTVSLGALPRAHAEDGDTMNFRFEPVLAVVGFAEVGMDFVVAPEWTLGPEVGYWHTTIGESGDFSSDGLDVTAYWLGARANWFKNGAFHSGLYVSPSVHYISLKATSGSLSASASAMDITGVVGYAWFWRSFNIMLGGGLSVPLGTSKVTVTDNDGNSVSTSISPAGSLALDFSLGWTF